MREVDISSFDGVRLRAYQTPTTTGRANVLLVLPLATRPTFVERAVSRLARDFNVFTWEARHLLEPEPPQGERHALSLDTHARDALAVMEHFQLPHASLVGYCSGAPLALRMAHVHAERFDKLVLVSGAYFLAPEVCELTQYERDVLALTPLIARDLDSAAVVFKLARASKAFHQPDHEFAQDITLPYADVETFHRYGLGLEQCIQSDARRDASALACPTLVLSGGRDDRTHPASSTLIASLLRHGQHSVDPEADHYALCRANDATLERMTQFLSTSAPAGLPRTPAPQGDRPPFSKWTRDVVSLFQEQVQRAPEALALVDGELRITYRELNTRANALARRLVELGVQPRALVGICLERSAESVVGCLAILKAGGAYVPIDHRYPTERIDFILRDSAVRWVVTTRELAPAVSGPHAVCIDAAGLTDGLAGTDLGVGITPDFSAYVMYTSGTTGEPKGVEVPQSGISRLVRHSTYLELDERVVVLHHSTCSFDAATFEIWAALLNGGRLVIHRPSLGLDALGPLLREHGITTLLLTTSVFHLVAEHKPEALGALRHVVTGGDVLRVREVKAVLERHPHLLVINGYGPTENTTFTCCFPITRDTPLGDTIPIGWPIGGTNVFILDAELRPVKPGDVGQLFTNGLGLAKGYLQRPELTRRLFIESPFPESGAVLYATGDLVREGPDGALHFQGRVDNQLKIRGFRVEPGEIEHALNQRPDVAESVVVAEPMGSSGEKQLVAYVKQRVPGWTLDPSELKQDLAARLPDYMVPARIHRVESFPLTHNGKIDRARLRAETASAAAPPPRAPAGTSWAQVVLEVWRARLGEPLLAGDASIFDHGASSLTIMVVQSELNERLRCRVDPTRLERAHTPLEWADVYQEHHSVTGGA